MKDDIYGESNCKEVVAERSSGAGLNRMREHHVIPPRCSLPLLLTPLSILLQLVGKITNHLALMFRRGSRGGVGLGA